MVAASAAPLALVVLEAVRVLGGRGPAFLSADRGDVADAYTRVSYLTQVASADRVLVLPLLGLAAVAWLVRPAPAAPARTRAVRMAAAGLGGLLSLQATGLLVLVGYLLVTDEPSNAPISLGDERFEALAAPLTAGLLVLSLSLLLVRLLLLPSQEQATAQTPDSLQQERTSALDEPAGRVLDPDTDGRAMPEQDPHALYRRPTRP